MKIKKIFLALLATIICLSSVSFINGDIFAKAMTIQEEEIVENPDDPEPRWWPGNPNPFPGSEAWLQQHIDYSSGDPTKSRECLIEAFGFGSLTGEALSWLAAGTFTVASLLKSFGTGIAISWLLCMLDIT